MKYLVRKCPNCQAIIKIALTDKGCITDIQGARQCRVLWSSKNIRGIYSNKTVRCTTPLKAEEWGDRLFCLRTLNVSAFKELKA